MNAGALRYPAFRWLAGGRAVAVLGNSVAPIALAFAVLDLTGKAFDLGLVVAARSATMAVFVLFGGVVADRLPRSVVLIGSAVLASVSQATVAAMVLTHTATIGRLMLFSAINGLVSAFTFPAASALVPQTVPASARTSANAINRLGANTAMILGASLGGLLVATVGPGWGLAVDAAGFLLAAGLYALVRVPDHRTATAAAASSSLWRDLRTGWREFVGRTWIWVIVLGFCFYNAALMGGFNVLGPTVADATFGRAAWGLVLAGQTAGLVAGALVAMRLRVRRLLRLGVAACLPAAGLLVVLSAHPAVPVLVVTAFFSGLAMEQLGIAWEVSLQEHVPAEVLARVYAYDALGSVLAIPAGQIAAGPLAAAVGVDSALRWAAVVLVVSVVAMLASRSVRNLRHDPAPVVAPVAEPAAASSA